jgi:hypothetical protein
MPSARAVRWLPAAMPASEIAEEQPIFVAQQVLHELQAIDPSGDGAIGFLVGDVAECPDSGRRYVVARGLVRVHQPFVGDRPLPVVNRAWGPLREELQDTGWHVLGWYHTHTVHGAAVSLADMETHRHFFTQPWQVALIIAPDAEAPAGWWYRPLAAEPGGRPAPLPFHELLDSVPEGAVQTALSWPGYRSTDVRVQPRPPRRTTGATAALGAVPPPLARTSGVLVPARDHFDEDDPVHERLRAERRRVRRVALIAGGVLSALAAIAVSVTLLAPLLGRTVSPSPSRAVALPVDPALVVAADSLDVAIRAYDQRKQLFDDRMMVCADLGAGLVKVEDAMVAFSTRLRARSAPADSAASVRERALFDGADAVERHFERTGCARP